jgi:hypothetical protein
MMSSRLEDDEIDTGRADEINYPNLSVQRPLAGGLVKSPGEDDATPHQVAVSGTMLDL